MGEIVKFRGKKLSGFLPDEASHKPTPKPAEPITDHHARRALAALTASVTGAPRASSAPAAAPAAPNTTDAPTAS